MISRPGGTDTLLRRQARIRMDDVEALQVSFLALLKDKLQTLQRIPGWERIVIVMNLAGKKGHWLCVRCGYT